MRIIITAALLALASGAEAQTLYKCQTKGQPTSYQSEPCDSQAKASKTWDATPERLTHAQQLERQRAAQRSADNARYMSRLAGTDGSQRGGHVSVIRTQSTDECRAAKARQAAFPRRGSDSIRRSLDELMRKACY